MLLRLAICIRNNIIIHGPFVSTTATDDEAKPHGNRTNNYETVAKGLKSRSRTI